MPCETLPDFARRTIEANCNQARVIQQARHGRTERPQDDPVAGGQRRRLRPILGSHSKISRAEHHRREVVDPIGVERAAARQPHFDGATRRQVRSEETGGQVAASFATTRSPRCNRAGRADRGQCSMRPSGRTTSSFAPECLDGPVAAIMVRPVRHRPARLGRTRHGHPDDVHEFASRDLGSLQQGRVGIGQGGAVQRGVHIAGVEREKSNPLGSSSSAQIRVIWWSAALLAPYAPQWA